MVAYHLIICLIFIIPYFSLISSIDDYLYHNKLIESHNTLDNNDNNNNCPISTILDPIENLRYSYPISVFNKSLLSQIPPDDNWKCFSGGALKNERHYHNCSSKIKVCPVHDQNLFDVVFRSSKWVQNNSMCGTSFQNNSKPMNIIFSGGSVVAGMGTYGYECYPDEDKKCKTNTLPGLTNFANYLEFYFKHKNMNHIHIYNLADCGISSSIMSERLMERFNRFKLIPKLTNSDLVIIDHSSNDVSDADHTKNEDKLRKEENKKGLEILIRNFLSMGCPNIIILETAPYESNYIRDNIDYGYKSIYTPIAKHYGLPIWSISDAISSKYLDLYQQEYSKYLRNDKDIRIDHVAWFIQLYYADIILTLLNKTVSKCHDDDEYKIQSYQNKIIIPKPLTENLDIDSCDGNFKPILDIRAVDVHNKYHHQNHLNIIGNWNIMPYKSWKVKSEKRNRFGWVHEVNLTNTDSINPNLTFSTLIPYKEVKIPNEKKLLLKLEYLKTYENAGQVQVYVCNKNLGIIDALWDSYNSFKYSLPAYTNYVIDSTLCGNTNNITVTIEYLNQIVCKDTMNCANETVVRTQSHKFKVISAKICISM